jgi:hypothetical protein
MLLAPIGNPEPRGYSPLDTLLFLAAMVSTLSKLGGFHAVKNEKSEKHFHHGWWFSDFPAWDIALFLQIPMCPLWRKQKKERFSYDFIWSISRRLTWRKLI